MPAIDFFRQHMPAWPTGYGPFTVLFQANSRADLHAFLSGLAQAQSEGLGPTRVLAVLPLDLTHDSVLACPHPGLPGWQHWQAAGAQWHALCTNEPVKAARQWPGQCCVDFPSGRVIRAQPEVGMPPFSLPTSARVAVVGAGLAGSNVARVLCAAGHEVHLYDQASAVAQGASGNALGAFHPHITRGDSPLSQLSRLGHDMTLHTLFQLSQQGLLQQGVDWDTPGHLQTVPPAEVVHTQETLAQLGFPGTTVHWAEPGQYAPGPLGGLYFPRGGWVKPPRWVQANLQACGHRLHLHLGQQIASLEQLRRTHDAVVVACAQGSQLLAPVVGAAPGVVKGQITQVAFQHDGLPVLSGESYAIAPSGLGIAIVGATYERPVLDLNPSDEADALNLGRFASAFPSLQLGPVLGRRCAVRFVWHDRLPVVGPMPGSPGVYWCSAFASRGIVWAALAAWWLGEHMAGHPLSTRLLNRMLPRPAGKGA